MCSPSPPSHLPSHRCHLRHPGLLQGALCSWDGLLGAGKGKQRCRWTSTARGGAADSPQRQHCHRELSRAGRVCVPRPGCLGAAPGESKQQLHSIPSPLLNPTMHICTPPACTQSDQDKQTAHATTGTRGNTCWYFCRAPTKKTYLLSTHSL